MLPDLVKTRSYPNLLVDESFSFIFGGDFFILSSFFNASEIELDNFCCTLATCGHVSSLLVAYIL